MATPGYLARLILADYSDVSAAQLIDMAQIGSSKSYRCDQYSESFWSPGAIAVYDDSALVDPEDYTVNWLRGTIIFDPAYTVTGPVQVEVDLFAATDNFVGVRGFQVNATRESLDASQLQDAFMRRVGGRIDASGAFDAFELEGPDTAQRLDQMFASGALSIFEFRPIASSSLCHRAYVRVFEVGATADLGDVYLASVSWQSTSPHSGINGYDFGDPLAT